MSELVNVYLIRGDEPSIISRELEKLTISLLGDEDKSLAVEELLEGDYQTDSCLLYTSPSPRDPKTSRMPSSA